MVEEEFYGFVSFNSIESAVTVVRSNIAISPFSEQLPWPLHRFYLNRFICSKPDTMVTDTDLSQKSDLMSSLSK